MKNLLLFLVLMAVSNLPSFSKDSDFSTTINEWARYSGLNVETIDAKAGIAVLSKNTDDGKESIALTIYDEMVELKVLFYNMSDVLEQLGDESVPFLMNLLELNAQYNFGGWGIEKVKEDFYLGLFYGIPIEALTQENFKYISSYMISYSADVTKSLTSNTKKGMGFADESNIDTIIDDLKDLGKKHHEKLKKDLKK